MELSQFGWNALTIGFLGAVFFTLVEAWGVWQQNRAIWKNQSGESVSVIWFSYFAALLAVVFIYGIAIKSILLILNGLLISILHIPILVGLWRFKGFTKTEKVMCACFLAAVVAMVIAPFKDWFFLLFTAGNILFSLNQPYEIWKNKNSGVVEIKLLAVYLASTLFWLIYGFAIGDWVLQIVNPAYMVTLTITVLVWFKYRRAH